MNQRRAAPMRSRARLVCAAAALLLCACSLHDSAPEPLPARPAENPARDAGPSEMNDAQDARDAAPQAPSCVPVALAISDDACVGENCEAQIGTRCDAIVALDAQQTLACSVLADGTLSCFGAHKASLLEPEAAADLDLIDVALGYDYACGLERSGRLSCWGTLPDPVLDAGGEALGEYVEIAASRYGVCARDAQGAIVCWGKSSLMEGAPSAGGYEQLACGDLDCCATGPAGVHCWGEDAGVWIDAAPFIGLDAEQVAVGHDFACALLDADTVTCAGPAHHGRTIPPEAMEPVRAIGAYEHGACAALIAGGVVCWGQDLYGLVSDAPREGDFVSLDGNASRMCAVTEAGERVCWGLDPEALRRPPEGRYTSIVAGTAHYCALSEEEMVTCWGDDSRSQLDAIALATMSIVGGLDRMCALDRDGSDVLCWGQGAPADDTIPSRLIGLFDWDMELDHFCALRLIGSNDPEISLGCWGADQAGQSSPPIGIRNSESSAAVAVGQNFSCVLRDTGSIVCWGSKDHWEQVDAKPVLPTSNHDSGDAWIKIEGSRRGLCAQSRMGAIECWGEDFSRRRDVPASAEPGTLAAGGQSACALVDGLPVCWGAGVASWLEPPPSAREGFAFSALGICALSAEKEIVCR